MKKDKKKLIKWVKSIEQLISFDYPELRTTRAVELNEAIVNELFAVLKKAKEDIAKME